MTRRRELLARLRRLGNEKGSSGSPEVRERCYELFLDEVSEVASYRLLAAADDNMLYILFSAWCSWACDGLDFDGRQRMIVSSFPLLPQMKGPGQIINETKAENVLSIFGG